MSTRGLGGIYLRGETYWMHFSVGGKQRWESTGTSDKDTAVNKLKERLGQVARGEYKSGAEIRFEDLAKRIESDYVRNRRKSLRAVKMAIARLEKTFAGVRAAAITSEAIEHYRDLQLEDGRAPSTVNHDLAALKRMFNLAIRARLLSSRPYIAMLRVDNARSGFFEPEVFERLLGELPDYVAPVVEAAYATGWRRGEVVGLTWSRVDFEAETMRLEPGTTKNGDGRSFPWGAFPRLRDVLLAQREHTRFLEIRLGRIIPNVFHRDGRPISDFYTAWRDACKRAKCEGMLFHDLRRTAVRNLERAGVPRSVAMQLTGHKTESVYRRYAIVSEADLTAGVERLAALEARREARRAQQGG